MGTALTAAAIATCHRRCRGHRRYCERAAALQGVVCLERHAARHVRACRLGHSAVCGLPRESREQSRRSRGAARPAYCLMAVTVVKQKRWAFKLS